MSTSRATSCPAQQSCINCASIPACACSPAPAPVFVVCPAHTGARSTAGPKCPNIPSPGGAQARVPTKRRSSLARPHAINTTTTTTLAKLASSSHPPPSSRPPAPPPPPIDSQVPSVVVHRPSTSIADRPTAAAAPSISSSSSSNSHSAGSSALRGLLNRFSGSQQNREEHPAADTATSVAQNKPLPTPLYQMYSSTAGQQGPGSAPQQNPNRISDMSQYDDDQQHNSGAYGAAHGGDSRRDSYLDSSANPTSPNMTEDLRKFHSAGGAYTNVGQGGHLSEPSSPIVGANQHDADGDSNGDSSSQGSTKVDSRSPSAYRGRDGRNGGNGYGLSGGSHEQHGSESDVGHQYQDGGLYASRTANNSTGYVDAPLYHPSSPGSAQSHNTYGRFRTGSYPGGGLDSSRTSSIGTHEGANIPYNTSRTALNNEWRQSVDTTNEINATGGPGGDKYREFGTPDEKDSKMASYLPVAPSSPAMGATTNKEKPSAPLPDGKKQPEAAIVLSRVNRLAWIDGLRGIASIIIFTHHFSDLTWARRYPDVLSDGSTQGFIKNGQLAVGLYFLLGGRVLAHGFQRSAFAPPRVAKDSHGAVIPGAPLIRSAGPKWLSLSSSLFRRSIRLALPAIAIGFIQWQVCKLGGTSTAIQANLEVLRPTNLWESTWCEIGDFGGFLQFCLDLFTNPNHQYMLYVGSALWTTYDQFWGSTLVYILAALMAPIAWKGRYLLFLIISISLWYVSSPNFLYVIGLWLSDLHASGFVRKLQDHWKPTVLLEVCVMALALSMIAGGGAVAKPADHAIGHITINNGRFGWNPEFAWPHYMFMSNWIPAVCIMVWLEVSHAMQWFASWGLFVWVGKVSYGFYLMQFLTLYSLMPHLILHFNSLGHSYWDIVIPTYCVCLLFNIFVAWVSYHLLDRVGLKMGKWIWDGFFVTKPKNAGAMPLKFAKWLGDVIVHGPGRAIKGTSSRGASKWAGFKALVHTIMNWRTPATRPPIPEPTDPEVLAQLHSTRWTSDLSGNKEAMRCHKLLRWQQWAWVFHLFWIPGMTAIWTIYHPTGQWTWDGATFSTLWRFIWILSVPNCLAGWLGFITPDWALSKEKMDEKPVCREHIRNFFIVLVTKGSNESAVRRGYNKLYQLEKFHPAVKTVVLTDEPYVYPDLQNIVCPKDYVSPLGKAKYKARALDYLRYHVSLGVYDWILHMDEESVTDAETIRRCFDFIRYTPHHFGQGIILYNGEGYWENWYFTVADGIRVGDDLARFHFQNTVIQRPVFGVHGSFLMTNGEMENECTWDFGSLAEDFEFSQDAWRRGFTCGRIHGIIREQSPTTLRDFLKQRRRWFMGIRDIKGMYGLPHLAVNLWTVGVFTLAVTVINLPFTLIDKSLTPFWLAICANFCFITFYTIYSWGLLFQELDYGQPWWMIPLHLIPGLIIQPFASIAEGLAAIWAMSSEDFGAFEVIQKR